jgi:hypothetical protein
LERREVYVLVIVLATLLSVGISQHLLFGPKLPNASALQIAGSLGIYRDQNCLSKVSSIDWGSLTPGESRNAKVYVRNESNQTLFLSVTPQNWNPVSASNCLCFSWTIGNSKMEKGEIAEVTLILYVSLYASGVTTFSFEIIFTGLDQLLGDVNKDGIVDLKDVYEVARAYGSRPDSPNWNPNCDLNEDLFIDIKDYTIVCKNYGQNCN